MNRIDARFADLRKSGKAAFIPFFTAGDPDLDTTLRLLLGAEDAGADVIELGFPFSDPLADGPTIQASYTRALDRGLRVAEVLDAVRRARAQGCRIPIVAMISYSIVFRLGFGEFVRQAVDAGLDGATIPDLPIEEAAQLIGTAAGHGLNLICFVTPATPEPRRVVLAEHAGGFIYYIAVRGITGERTELPADLAENLAALKGLTEVPVAVGFGISTPPQVAAVARVADGVIVGSAVIKRIAGAAEQGLDAAQAGLDFIRTMAAPTKE